MTDAKLPAQLRSVLLLLLVLLLSGMPSVAAPQTMPTEDAESAYLSAMTSTRARERAENNWQEAGIEGFHAAVSLGMKDVVEQRLKARPELANAAQDATSPLTVAIANDQRAMATLLLENGAKPDDGGFFQRTPLLIAAQFGHPWAVEALLKAGAKLPEDSSRAEQLLNESVSGWDAARDDVRTVELLIDAGIIQRVGDRISSALVNAGYANPPLLRVIVPHIKDKQQFTEALAGIAGYGKTDAALILIEAGADVNGVSTRRPERYTPLHEAASAGRNDMVSYLLSRNADPTLKDANGKTAAEIADSRQHKSTAHLIRTWRKPAAGS